MTIDLAKLREESGAMFPYTVRLKRNTTEQIDRFCRASGIPKATLLRTFIEQGWEQLQEQTANEANDG